MQRPGNLDRSHRYSQLNVPTEPSKICCFMKWLVLMRKAVRLYEVRLVCDRASWKSFFLYSPLRTHSN